MNRKENVKRHKDYTQVCVWEGTTLDGESEQEMVDWFMEQGFRVQFLEIIMTKPDRRDKKSGGRSDVFLAVHKDDVGKFSIPRLQMGIRWIEDVLSKNNYRDPIYPNRVFDYKTWEA